MKYIYGDLWAEMRSICYRHNISHEGMEAIEDLIYKNTEVFRIEQRISSTVLDHYPKHALDNEKARLIQRLAVEIVNNSIIDEFDEHLHKVLRLKLYIFKPIKTEPEKR